MLWARDARRASARAAAASLLATTLVARAGHAQLADPSYGRVDGDVTLIAGLGAALGARGVRGEVEGRLRYLETAGLFASYEDGATFGSAAEPQRLLGAGLELRPLFLFRWLQGHETQRARLDLTVDSLGLELGAVFAQPAGAAFGSRPGVEVGLGAEVPLADGARGPWIGLHGGFRWSNDALASGSVRDADDRAAFLSITVAWHELVMAHVVDMGDRAP
jgi:hypothetical protein